jgi:hypothetical protein
MYNNHLKLILNQWNQEMLADLITAMKVSGSKTLFNTLKYKGLKEETDLIISTIEGDSGVYFMSEGRAAGGGFPPLTDIKKWIASHNIKPLEAKLGEASKILTPNALDSMAFSIAKNIQDFGTKMHAKHFLERFKLTPEWNSKILIEYRNDVKQSLLEIANRLNSQ